MHRRDVLAGLAGAATGAAVAGSAVGARSSGNGTQGGYEPLGSVPLEGTRELVPSEDGQVGYVAVDDGIATVDLSEPTDPSVLAERRGFLADRDGGPLARIWDVWPDGDRLLAAGPANAPVPLAGALLFDVSDPADPTLLDSVETDYPVHNLHFEDGIAYLTANGLAGNPLVLLDTAGDAFREVARWSLFDLDSAWRDVHLALRQLHDVSVQDGVAYLAYWDAGTYLLDVSDPADPAYLGHVSDHDRESLAGLSGTDLGVEYTGPPGNDHFVQVDDAGELMAVGREAWAAELDGECLVGGPGGVDLYDVSDPGDIVHRSTIEAPESYLNTQEGPFTTAHNLDLVGDRLYTSWYFGGVKLHDVSDPAAPEELAAWRDPGTAAFWTARSAVQGEYFVASSASSVAGIVEGVEGRIYVFPDEPGEQTDPPSLTDPPEDFEALPDCEDVDVGDSGSGGDETTSGEDEAGSGAGEEAGSGGSSGSGGSDEAGEDGDEEDSVPGFGVAAAAAGLGFAAWRLRGRDGES